MKRRTRQPADTGIPERFLGFTAGDCSGASAFQQWKAWDEARQAWAMENLPAGADDLPTWSGEIPDQPWAEVEGLI